MGSPAYQYNQIEAALVAAFDIGGDRLPAFRGRLRHLRKRKVPELPVVGKGGVSTYSDRDVMELVWAVEMEAMGVSPAMIPEIIKDTRGSFPADLGLESARRNPEDWWFIVVPNFIVGGFHAATFTAEKALDEKLRQYRKDFGRVCAGNIGMRLKKVFKVIEDTTPAKRGR